MAHDPMKRKLLTKKVLVAAVGIGAVSYVIACGDTTTTSGNLMAPDDAGQPKDGSDNDVFVSSGNLMAPDTGAIDAPADAPKDGDISDVVSSGNLMPPPDAGTDGSSDAGGD